MSEEPQLAPLPPVEERIPKTIPKTPPVPHGMRKFTVFRRFDRSGVSGTGIIIQGVVFADGQCVYQWMNGKSPELEYRQSFKRFLEIHIESHPENHSVITWEDGEEQIYGPPSTVAEVETTDGT